MNALCFPLALWASVFVNEDKPVSPLPAEWHGVWTGKLVITDFEGKTSETKVVLKVEPVPDTRNVKWVTTTGEGEISSTRLCTLAPAGEKPGFFRLDEGGVGLDVRLVNGVICTQSEFGGRLQTVRYELRGDVLRYEVTWSKPDPKKTGSSGNVQGYAVETVQTAELKKR
jgi:hypothetical protein